MNRLAKQALLGSTIAFGFALTPVMAQHGGHKHGHGEHEHGHKDASPTGLPKCPVMDEPVNFAVCHKNVE